MRMYRCGNSDRVYFPIREHFLKVSGRAHRRIPTAYSFELGTRLGHIPNASVPRAPSEKFRIRFGPQ